MTNLNGNFLQFTFASAVDWLSFYSHRITTNDSALFHFIRFDWQLKRSGKLEWAQAFIFCNQFHDECQFLTLIQFETFQLIFFFSIFRILIQLNLNFPSNFWSAADENHFRSISIFSQFSVLLWASEVTRQITGQVRQHGGKLC